MLLRSILWDYAGRFSLLFATLVVTGVLSRLLTPEEFGAVGIVVAISGLATLLLEFGFVSAIVQQPEVRAEQLSTIFYLVLGGSAAVYALIVVLAPAVASFYQVPALTALLRVSGLSFLINAFNLVPNALIIKQMRFKEQSLRNVAITVGVGVVAIGLAYWGWGVWALVLQALLSPLLSFFVNVWLTRWRPRMVFRWAAIAEMFHYSKFLFFSSVLDSIYTRMDALLIGKALNMQSVGFYSRAKGMETMVQGITTSSLNAVMFPFFSKMQDDLERLKAAFHRFFGLICGVLFLFTGLAYINAHWVFEALFGPQWSVSAHYYRIIAMVAFVYPLSALMLSVVSARGNSKDFFRAEVSKKIVYTPTFFFLWWGIEAYLYAWATAVLIAFFINLYFLRRTLSIGIFPYVKTVLSYSGLLVCFLTALHGVAKCGFYEDRLGCSLLASVLFVVCFLLGAYVISPDLVQLFRQKARALRLRMEGTPVE
ncbi:MAG TPA: lipopolysaccharide biosynthesis protein [Saprospiraceae bacterium]|nr:lipopolysaccharide biosynthesis protein [Saprospiraceae bacterium]